MQSLTKFKTILAPGAPWPVPVVKPTPEHRPGVIRHGVRGSNFRAVLAALYGKRDVMMAELVESSGIPSHTLRKVVSVMCRRGEITIRKATLPGRKHIWSLINAVGV